MVTQDDLFNCAGWQAINRIGIVAEMHNVFQQNYLEMLALFVKIHNDMEVSRETYKEAYHHLPQRIFNFLSASTALIDQTRRMMQFYVGKDIYTQYKQKVFETFENNKCAKFIKKLRNYQTHFRIEYPTPVRSLDDNKHWDVILLSEDLLKHPDEWDKPSKEFIEQCGTEINLNKTFSQYKGSIDAFYMWLYTILKQYHEKDLEEKNIIDQALGLPFRSMEEQLATIVN